MDYKKEFIKRYGGDEKGIRIFYAPGRVNMIGEHIDYNGGRVLPAALTMGIYCVVRLNGEQTIRIAATDLPDTWVTDMGDLQSGKAHSFGNYQIGVFDEMQKAGFTTFGCDILYHSTMPIGGSGLSSSAAYEVSTAYAIATLHNEYHHAKGIDLTQIACICQKAENNFVGVNCGIMDQFASAHGKKDNLIVINCDTLEYEHIPLTLKEHKIIVINTNKKHKLSSSQYNTRRSECESALEIIKQTLPNIKHLCDTTMSELGKYSVNIEDKVLANRAHHVVSENERVEAAIVALKSGNLKEFGLLMNSSHASLRDLYEVTGKELDALADLSYEVEGVVGARMTGGGFGGCAVAIVRTDCVGDYVSHVQKGYEKKIGYAPTFYISDIGGGVCEVREEA